MQSPNSPDDWKRIVRDFKKIWNLLHCVGAIDGKHVAITSPINSGSFYYNYKSYFCTVLMAICDARYVFTLADIGNYDSNNDSGIFRHSAVGKAFFDNAIKLPELDRIFAREHWIMANSIVHGKR